MNIIRQFIYIKSKLQLKPLPNFLDNFGDGVATICDFQYSTSSLKISPLSKVDPNFINCNGAGFFYIHIGNSNDG